MKQGADNGIDSIMRASLSHSWLAFEGGFGGARLCQV
jgi:hypothetical protein